MAYQIPIPAWLATTPNNELDALLTHLTDELCALEQSYRDLGVRWHALPHPARAALAADAATAPAAAAARTLFDVATYPAAVLVAQGITWSAAEPARLVGGAVRRRAWAAARAHLALAASRLAEVRGCLVAAAAAVAAAFARVWEAPVDVGVARRALCAWVLTLPEAYERVVFGGEELEEVADSFV